MGSWRCTKELAAKPFNPCPKGDVIRTLRCWIALPTAPMTGIPFLKVHANQGSVICCCVPGVINIRKYTAYTLSVSVS